MFACTRRSRVGKMQKFIEWFIQSWHTIFSPVKAGWAPTGRRGSEKIFQIIGCYFDP